MDIFKDAFNITWRFVVGIVGVFLYMGWGFLPFLLAMGEGIPQWVKTILVIYGIIQGIYMFFLFVFFMNKVYYL
jgi:heme/copper-type cytochrome/quinol oxidase subunit 4